MLWHVIMRFQNQIQTVETNYKINFLSTFTLAADPYFEHLALTLERFTAKRDIRLIKHILDSEEYAPIRQLPDIFSKLLFIIATEFVKVTNENDKNFYYKIICLLLQKPINIDFSNVNGHTIRQILINYEPIANFFCRTWPKLPAHPDAAVQAKMLRARCGKRAAFNKLVRNQHIQFPLHFILRTPALHKFLEKALKHAPDKTAVDEEGYNLLQLAVKVDGKEGTLFTQSLLPYCYSQVEKDWLTQKQDDLALRELQNKINIDEVSSHGTALHISAKRGNAALVKLLLKKGANPNIQCGDQIPYQLLVSPTGDVKHKETVIALLKGGSDFPHTPNPDQLFIPRLLQSSLFNLNQQRLAENKTMEEQAKLITVLQKQNKSIANGLAETRQAVGILLYTMFGNDYDFCSNPPPTTTTDETPARQLPTNAVPSLPWAHLFQSSQISNPDRNSLQQTSIPETRRA